MDVRNQSEVKHDLDSRLTPVKYDDLHRGESFTRQQTDFVPRHQYASSSPFHTDRSQPTNTSQQSPLLLHFTPSRTIYIKTTRMIIAPFMKTLKTTRKTYQSHMFILKKIFQTLLIQNIKPTMGRLFYQWAMFAVPFSQHIVDTAVNSLFLVPAVNYSQGVNLTTVPLHLSSVSNSSHS